MKRTYTAYHGNTEFSFESEHRAGSAANMEDAQRAARIRFGKPAPGYSHRIDGITLRQPCKDAPLGQFEEDLTMNEDERRAVKEAIDSGIIYRIGAKLYGAQSVFFIKDSHDWSRSQLERAIEKAFF